MLCSFAGPPRILRLHGRGEVLDDALEFGEVDVLPEQRRTVIRVEVERIADSCGFGVPLMTYAGERGQLADWVNRKTEEQLAEYLATKNARSIDGLPGLPGGQGASP